jgi:hypothetical protein
MSERASTPLPGKRRRRLILDLKERETVARTDCADWPAHRMTKPGELAEHPQREATRGNGPQSE